MNHRLCGYVLLSGILAWCSAAAAQSFTAYSDIGPELLAVETAYPSIAKRFSIGTSVQGRTLWAIKITDNVLAQEDKPEFRYISTMHGDEITGVEMSLNMIDHLTTNYGSDSRVTTLVDSVEIWIMPLMNPDGYDRASRTRYNASGIDLNRNFPDPFTSPSNTTAGRAPETAAVMNWGFAQSFTLAANFHGGAVVVNYPFDTNASGSSVYTASPDDDVFIFTSKEYSQYNAPMWNSASFLDGITNGADWYAVNGGMQDWSYLYTGCNEVTIELSNAKEPPASQIATFWAQNRDSMLAFMETSLIGVRGVVTDGATGLPLAATVTVAGRVHSIFTDPDVGDYHRLLLPGMYDLTFTSAGLDPVTVSNVVVSAGSATRLDVVMGEGPPTTSDVNVIVVGSDSITLSATDPNSDPLDLIITSLPAHGDLSDPGAGAILSVPYTLAAQGAVVDYTTDTGYTGPDGFQFKANDGGTPPGGGDSNVSTVGITVYAPPPVITTTTLPDAYLNQAYSPVQLTASDGEAPLAWTLVTDTNYVETDTGTNGFAASGVAQLWFGDDQRWDYTLPFAFPFYDASYTAIRIWSNGFIDFGAFSGTSYDNSDAQLIANRLIAPLWDDLKTNATGRDIFIDESVPGEVTIRWNAQTYSGAISTHFAATLVADGTIRLHYGAGNNPITATVGISDGNGARYTLSSLNPATSLLQANTVEFQVPASLPPGMSVSGSGLLAGTPSATGNYQPRVRVTDAVGRFDEKLLSLTVGVSSANGDYDNDGDVDLTDFAAFQRCDGQPAAGACGDAFEFDVNGTIDLADYDALANVLNGP